MVEEGGMKQQPQPVGENVATDGVRSGEVAVQENAENGTEGFSRR